MKFLPLFIFLFLGSCTSVSITERKQLIILDDIIYPQAFKAYDDFKKNKLITEGRILKKFKR